jgi:hypothetical protein
MRLDRVKQRYRDRHEFNYKKAGLHRRRFYGRQGRAVADSWSALLTAVEHEARARGAVLVLVVCAQRDNAKRTLLRDAGLFTASEWYVRLL